MTKTRLIILLLLILLLIFFPKKIKADNEVEKASFTPIEEQSAKPALIEIPAWVRQDQVPNYLKIIAAFPNAPIMVRIADAESDLCFNNKNPKSTARGCFQIVRSTWTDNKCTGDVMNVDDNIQCAQKLYAANGTSPWNESKSTWGKYATR